ncbi:MAG TPA: c-type cytochrome [Polyangiaceae bacterium]|nr:c-type cytochrome [Polyangiaceae bacterium]
MPLLCVLAGAGSWAACASEGAIRDNRGNAQGAGGAPGGGGPGGAATGTTPGAGAGAGEAGGGGSAGGAGGAANGAGGAASLDGLPCEVAAVLTAHCVSCHSEPLAGGAPMPLLRREHLLAPTPTEAQKSAGERAVERMKSASSPMPPSGQLSDADIATLEAWVSDGMPAGACGGPGGAGGSAGSAGGAGGAPPVGEGGLPCDVQSFLTAQCTSCHSNPPTGGAPMPLTSLGALLATNGSGVRFAERALARLQNGTMPPGGGLSAAQFQAFADWVDGGTPEGTCEPADDPFDDPPRCSSGQSVPFCADDVIASGLLGDDEDDDDDDDDCAGPTMNPGMACGSGNCHGSGGEGPRLRFGGTVYRTGHEPDRCVGGPAAGTAQVVVTGANGVTVTRPVNAAGNFLLLQSQASGLTFPIRAEVHYDGRVRKMATPQMSGDCNSCHTQGGKNGAPGRIVLP